RARLGVGPHERLRVRRRRLAPARLLRLADPPAALHHRPRGRRLEVGVMARKNRLGLDSAQLSQLVSVVLAMIVVVLANVIGARRFTRWDWTSNKRYSLTSATIQTLHDLPEPIQVWVLLG